MGKENNKERISGANIFVPLFLLALCALIYSYSNYYTNRLIVCLHINLKNSNEKKTDDNNKEKRIKAINKNIKSISSIIGFILLIIGLIIFFKKIHSKYFIKKEDKAEFQQDQYLFAAKYLKNLDDNVFFEDLLEKIWIEKEKEVLKKLKEEKAKKSNVNADFNFIGYKEKNITDIKYTSIDGKKISEIIHEINKKKIECYELIIKKNLEKLFSIFLGIEDDDVNFFRYFSKDFFELNCENILVNKKEMFSIYQFFLIIADLTFKVISSRTGFNYYFVSFCDDYNELEEKFKNAVKKGEYTTVNYETSCINGKKIQIDERKKIFFDVDEKNGDIDIEKNYDYEKESEEAKKSDIKEKASDNNIDNSNNNRVIESEKDSNLSISGNNSLDK